MRYISTRGNSEPVKSKEAILRGIAPDGGLYVPERIPEVTMEFICGLSEKTYADAAESILSLYLTDYTCGEIREAVEHAYKTGRFDDEEIAPVRELGGLSAGAAGRGGRVDLFACDGPVHVLELFHGPTCAFKDVALQLLPRLLVTASRDSGDGCETVILAATSGDTGKAALEGFKDVPGTRVVVFYPENGVSEVQKLQMVTQEGGNVGVAAVRGNFDDAQTGVKRIFSDREYEKELLMGGKKLSSANSINWGRLVPQIVYYFRAYARLISKGAIAAGDEVVFAVPTGNFGNILSGWYAKKMGLPVKKLICASNSNKVLADFINTGVYDRRREFVTTVSPSMDILISSNLERLLFEISGRDARQVGLWMDRLFEAGEYDIGSERLEAVREILWGGFAAEDETKKTIADVFDCCGYLPDTHSAVGARVYRDYLGATGDNSPAVIVCTASPFKFAKDVLDSIRGCRGAEARSEDGTGSGNGAAGGKEEPNGIECLKELEALSGIKIPGPLKDIDKKPELHFISVDKTDMKRALEDILVT